jgi:hypothetical protein
MQTINANHLPACVDKPHRLATDREWIWHVAYPISINNCPQCENLNFTDHLSVKKHWRAFHFKGCRLKYVCSKCDKTWDSIFGVASHFPKCKDVRQVPNVPDAVDVLSDFSPCTHCQANFQSTRGLAIHMSRCHKDTWEAEKQLRGKTETRWPPEEMRVMARIEATLDGSLRDLNQRVSSLFTERTLEAIRNKKRCVKYQRMTGGL